MGTNAKELVKMPISGMRQVYQYVCFKNPNYEVAECLSLLLTVPERKHVPLHFSSMHRESAP